MSRGKLLYGSGRAQVEISGAHRDAFQAVIDGVIPKSAAAIDGETRRVWGFARAKWPVKTGKSKRALEQGFRVEGDQVVGFVRCRTNYAWHIKWGVGKSFGFRRGSRVANDLIFKPGKKGADRVAAVVADELAALAAGRG